MGVNVNNDFVLPRLGQMMDVSLDSSVHKSQVHGTYHQLDTTGTLMLGGAGNTEMLVQDLTRGHFTRGFQVMVIGICQLQ